MAMSPAPTARAAWGDRALDVARASAIFIAVAATMSTAATSIGAVFFLIALLLSGRIHHVAADAWRTPAGKAVLVFIAWLLLSSLWSAVGPEAGLRDFWAWRKLVYFYLALPLFTEAKWKHRAVVALVYACAVAVVLSYISIVLHVQFRRYDEGVMGVVLTNHAVQGITFAVAAAASAFLASQAKGAARWAYAWVAAALVINVLFFGTGRTGYLAIVGVTLCWAVLRGGLRYTAVAAMALAVLLASAYAFSPTFHGRMMKGWNELNATGPLKGETSIGVRVVFAKNALALIAERPVFGHGLGSFKSVYAKYVDARYTGYDALHAGDPHNQYLYIVFEQGLIGLAVFLGLIVTLFKSFPNDGYGRLAACALTAWCLGCLFNSHFRTFPEGHFYALLIAILGANAARPRIGPRLTRAR
jgi:O-antigen ligase